MEIRDGADAVLLANEPAGNALEGLPRVLDVLVGVRAARGTPRGSEST